MVVMTLMTLSKPRQRLQRRIEHGAFALSPRLEQPVAVAVRIAELLQCTAVGSGCIRQPQGSSRGSWAMLMATAYAPEQGRPLPAKLCSGTSSASPRPRCARVARSPQWGEREGAQ